MKITTKITTILVKMPHGRELLVIKPKGRIPRFKYVEWEE